MYSQAAIFRINVQQLKAQLMICSIEDLVHTNNIESIDY